jgi:hypothetical protein
MTVEGNYLRRGRGRRRKEGTGVNMIKAHYIHV